MFLILDDKSFTKQLDIVDVLYQLVYIQFLWDIIQTVNNIISVLHKLVT